MNVNIGDGLWLRVDRDIIEGGKVVKGKEKAFTKQIRAGKGIPPMRKEVAERFDVTCNGKVWYFYLGD